MDSATLSQFPHFADGDTSVVISLGRIYQLHSHTLRRCSPHLTTLLNSFPGAKLTRAAKEGGSAAYCLQLVKVSNDDIGQFIRMRVSVSGRIDHTIHPSPSLNVNGLSVDDDKDRIWEWLFGTFYGIAPRFNDTDLATVLPDCMGLTDVAESIGAADHVQEAIDLALMRQDAVLWNSIAVEPVPWAELGHRIHSPTIFKEAVIHLIGQWQMLSEEKKDELRDETRNLCQQKWEHLDLARQVIEIRILGHYPTCLHRRHADKPTRSSYSTDIFMWMALSFFRQYFAQAISDGRNRLAEDGGYAFYTALAQGGQAYLHHKDFESFHQYFPMSAKACGVLEAHMNVLKEDVKIFVKDLMHVRVHAKPNDKFKMNWLTCAEINKEDLPWERSTTNGAEAANQSMVWDEDGYGDADNENGHGDGGLEDHL